MYGTKVEYLSKPDDKYGFVDEHEVRLAAGIALFFATYSFISIVFFGAFTLPLIFLGMLWADFVLKVFIDPQYSIFGSIARIILKKKEPYYVGAMQKRFAWSIGFVLSSFAFFCILIISGFLPSFNIGTGIYELVLSLPVYHPFAVPISAPIIACFICIFFMSLEAFFGYCVGCKIYAKLVQWGWMKKIPGQNCAGNVCAV